MIHGRKEELRKEKRRAPLAAEAEQFKGALGALRETLWVQIGPYSKVEHSEASGSEPWFSESTLRAFRVAVGAERLLP